MEIKILEERSNPLLKRHAADLQHKVAKMNMRKMPAYRPAIYPISAAVDPGALRFFPSVSI